MRVVVVGGGVVGLSCAYELERAGAEVTVVEHDRCGGATLSRERRLGSSVHLDPHARPGVTAQALKMLFKHDGSQNQPQNDRTSCAGAGASGGALRGSVWGGPRGADETESTDHPALQRPTRLGRRVRDAREASLIAISIRGDTRGVCQGCWKTARTAGYAGEVQLLGKRRFSRWNRRSATPSQGRCTRRTTSTCPRHPGLGPRRLPGCQGVEILEHAEVHALEPAGKGRWLVSTSTEKLAADRIVVAAGMWSSDLLGAQGFRIPLESGKATVSRPAGGERPRPAAELAEPNVACPFPGRHAHLGNLRLGRKDISVNRRLIDGVLHSASVFLRDWVVEEPRFEWARMRPTTPDDLPLIGAVPGFEHLYVATGHGMLGVTLAPATAVALAPRVLEGRTVPELEPFRLDRFAGRRANA